MNSHRYPEEAVQAIYRVIKERRDMRHFLPNPIDPNVLKRILSSVQYAPSVGLMQPCRILRITDQNLRRDIHRIVDQERIKTSEEIAKHEGDSRKSEFLSLKVEGILECGELLVVSLSDKRDEHIFGRRTLPEMDLASVSCAIQNLWLAARAEGIGMGWVSIFDPNQLSALLKIPSGAKPIAILCLGHVNSFYKEPMLIETGWRVAQPLEQLLMENFWDPDK